MSDYLITVKVDQTWFDILGQTSRHQDGFEWIDTEGIEE